MFNRNQTANAAKQQRLVLTYAAELELEVDRLRRRDRFLQEASRNFIREMLSLSKVEKDATADGSVFNEIGKTCNEFRELLRDVNEPDGYHPAFDQVIAIAIRPLAEQVFRWQQRFNDASSAVLHLDLRCDHLEWFPARFRHILDNLIAHALGSYDSSQEERRLELALQEVKGGYELQLSDNGREITIDAAASASGLFHRSAPTRSAGLGVGLAVVRLLAEQCCGTFHLASNDATGTTITVFLPRYQLDDHIE